MPTTNRIATDDIIARESQALMNTYARLPIVLVDGNGCRVTDADGREYLDLVAGIATCSLGHRHPALVEAVKTAADGLWHVSNLYHTTPQLQLAEELCEAAGMEREAMAGLSGPHPDVLADVSITRRLSRYLSHELRQLTGPTATRFGEIRLCNFFRSSLSWEAAERRTASTLPDHEGNGVADDKPVNRGDES